MMRVCILRLCSEIMQGYYKLTLIVLEFLVK